MTTNLVRTCPCCGVVALVRDTRDRVVARKDGQSVTIKALTGDYCNACGEVILDAVEGQRFMDGLTKWDVDGVEVEMGSGNVFADLDLPEPEKLLRASRAHGRMVLVIDLEATCCDQGSIQTEAMEIIEVGAVWATPDGEVIDAMQRFVRPTERPTLTPFCMSLTHIQQAQIDAAPSWPTVAAELAEFARLHVGQCWGSWGAYDRRQIERESARHGLADPLAGLPHQNLKAAFAKRRKIKQVGMATALQIVGLELEGEHHRALCDARNIARLLPWSLA